MIIYLPRLLSYIKDSSAYQKISFRKNMVVDFIARNQILQVGAKWALCGMIGGVFLGAMIIYHENEKNKKKKKVNEFALLEGFGIVVFSSIGLGFGFGFVGIIKALVQERFFKHNA